MYFDRLMTLFIATLKTEQDHVYCVGLPQSEQGNISNLAPNLHVRFPPVQVASAKFRIAYFPVAALVADTTKADSLGSGRAPTAISFAAGRSTAQGEVGSLPPHWPIAWVYPLKRSSARVGRVKFRLEALWLPWSQSEDEGGGCAFVYTCALGDAAPAPRRVGEAAEGEVAHVGWTASRANHGAS